MIAMKLSEMTLWVLLQGREHKELVLAVFVALMLPVLRSWMREWRLQKHLKKYPHMIKLEVQAIRPKKRWTLVIRKKLKTVYQQFLAPPAKWLAWALNTLLIQPTLFIFMSAYALLRATIRLLVRVTKIMRKYWKTLLRTMTMAAPPKDMEMIRSVLRRPKSERLEAAAKGNMPWSPNVVHFDAHSSGQVRVQQFCFNPNSEPGDRVEPEPSQTPPRAGGKKQSHVIEDPEEIGRQLSERSKIKQRIQTPPPKRRQKPRLPTLTMAEKENADTTETNQQIVAVVPTKIPSVPRQPEFERPNNRIQTPSPGLPPQPQRRLHTNTPFQNRTPRPYVHYSKMEPLSDQVRKRRMAGETLFAHSPQETSRLLELPSSQKGPKRRRAVLPKNKTYLPPISTKLKRERELEIYRQFSQKRNKETPDTPVVATPSVATQPAPSFNFSGPTPSGSNVVFGAPTSTTGEKEAAPPSASSSVFGASSATPAGATGDVKPALTFGTFTPAADINKEAAPASSFSFGGTSAATPAPDQPPAPSAPSTGEPNATTSFSFNAGLTAATPAAPPSSTAPDATPAPAFSFTSSTNGGSAAGFSFGNSNSAPPAQAPAAGGAFHFGTTSADATSATTLAPGEGGFKFGTTTAASFGTPAPGGFAFGSTSTPAPTTSGFNFGSSVPEANPNPAAFNSGVAPNPSFIFGSTASNTLQPGTTTGAGFGSTPNPSGGGSFFSPPAPSFASNAGFTPGFKFDGGPTPAGGFGQSPPPFATAAFGQPPAFGGATGFGQFQPTQYGSSAGFQSMPAVVGGFQATPAAGGAPGFNVGGAGSTTSGSRRRIQKNKGKRRI